MAKPTTLTKPPSSWYPSVGFGAFLLFTLLLNLLLSTAATGPDSIGFLPLILLLWLTNWVGVPVTIVAGLVLMIRSLIRHQSWLALLNCTIAAGATLLLSWWLSSATLP